MAELPRTRVTRENAHRVARMARERADELVNRAQRRGISTPRSVGMARTDAHHVLNTPLEQLTEAEMKRLELDINAMNGVHLPELQHRHNTR